MTVQKYRKKPIIIEAIKWTGTNAADVYNFTATGKNNKGIDTVSIGQDDVLFIKTLEGEMAADKGDMIIKGIKGEFYPCKPDIFKETYEEVEE